MKPTVKIEELEKILEKYSSGVLSVLKAEAPPSAAKEAFFASQMRTPGLVLSDVRTHEDEMLLKKLQRQKVMKWLSGSELSAGEAALEKALQEKLPYNMSGAYSPARNLIMLDRNLGTENLVETLKHEWLHALRGHIMPGEKTKHYLSSFWELEKLAELFSGREEARVLVKPEVTEFFALLSPVIDSYLEKTAPPRNKAYTLAELERVHQVFKGKSISEHAEQVKENYRKLVEGLAERLSGKYAERDEAENYISEEVKKFVSFCGLGENASQTYFRMILDIPDAVRSFAALFYWMVGYIGHDRENRFFPATLRGLLESELSGGLMSSFTNIDFFYQPIEIKPLTHRTAYDLAEVAINENVEKLAEAWPGLFFRDAEAVYGEYIRPLYNEINRMRGEVGMPLMERE